MEPLLDFSVVPWTLAKLVPSEDGEGGNADNYYHSVGQMVLVARTRAQSFRDEKMHGVPDLLCQHFSVFGMS